MSFAQIQSLERTPPFNPGPGYLVTLRCSPSSEKPLFTQGLDTEIRPGPPVDISFRIRT